MDQTSKVVSLVGDYFSLAYDPSSRKFEEVFHPHCQIQWLRDGALESMTAQAYRTLIHGRASPASSGAPRDEGILDIRHISPHLSAATVRVRIGNNSFVDHFVVHEVEGKWLITNKSSFLAGSFA
ncbi:nuclear transport factor 2 family protein [Lysobacter sp. K5869]|uniref:nuclear transport factor 2 family protein n=1 Tax=Lysobacter sp. K5869 TaxID=2820808 RepID=UPI001C06347A|nr:nuclear transport factor 2 family protein [Lysobacter sp. K5869]QWP77147.1 nuclear transport factor 2 family protein [Lysobacter sp. K5869]